ncbi:unnamed protein product [Rhodiola kirilowii]
MCIHNLDNDEAQIRNHASPRPRKSISGNIPLLVFLLLMMVSGSFWKTLSLSMSTLLQDIELSADPSESESVLPEISVCCSFKSINDNAKCTSTSST